MAGLGRRAIELGLVPLRIAVNAGSALLERLEHSQPGRDGESQAGEREQRSGEEAADGPPEHESEPKPWLDDAALARKVESIVFRDRSAAKGKIDVNAADGVVWLRGEAKTPDLINQLEQQAAGVPEVRRVENLLHLPKTPAPSRSDTPAGQRKTRRSRAAPAARKVTPRRVTSEKKRVEGEEATPVELASKRQGRRPAPLDQEAPSSTEGRDD